MNKPLSKPAVLGIVGYSGAGKTTLIESILPYLVTAGLRIATLKHTHHTIPLDIPGKDSWRHKQAGAVMSMLLTTHQLQIVQDIAPLTHPENLIPAYCADMDLVLIEGFTHFACAKIEVWRGECAKPLRCADDPRLIAIASDTPFDTGRVTTALSLNDNAGVAQFILRWLAFND
jgi:molybdopterin-guanine dinucleotide biosynthesis protein B